MLAVLAVPLAVCSEADAFVAASLTAFPLTARLAFLVVGPAVDVKLIALQAGTFGRRFTLWFAPVTFAVAVGASLLSGRCCCEARLHEPDLPGSADVMVGAALGSIAVDGRYLNYLKPAMHIPLLLDALVFLGIGIAELVALRRSAGPLWYGDPLRERRARTHAPRSGWLLVLPVLAIGFVAPPALGSWAAERDSGTVARAGIQRLRRAPTGDPVPLALGEYGVRAVWDDGRP